jgi:hypothetical protein
LATSVSAFGSTIGGVEAAEDSVMIRHPKI